MISWQNAQLRLLVLGVAPRLAVAALLVAMIWLGFFWATATPGAL